MCRMVFLSAAFLLMGVSVFAQQDPDDPGIRDSLIIGSAYIDSSGYSQFCRISVYLVTDDSVSFLFIPIRWTSDSYLRFISSEYFPFHDCSPGIFDTVMYDQEFIRFFYWVETSDCNINTHGLRYNLYDLRLIIPPNTPPQVIRFDTTRDDRHGPVMFGLSDAITEITPAVSRGTLTIGPASGIDDETSPPREFVLSQNYPNPFNAQTTITYTQTRSGPVVLNIYNLLGERVATVFEGAQDAGEHSAIWDAGEMPSGIYFCRMTAGDDARVMKMILMK